jgi:methyl-accepting chemotaxis protein
MNHYGDIVEVSAAAFAGLNDHPHMLALLKNVMATTNKISDLYYTTKTNRLSPGGYYLDAGDWNPPDDWNAEARDWFQMAVNKPGLINALSPYVDPMSNRLVITFSLLAKDASGTPGIMAADVFLDDIDTIVEAERITPDGSTVLVDNTGLFITNPDKKLILKKTIFQEDKSLNKDQLLSPNGSVTIADGRYVCSAQITGTDWHIVCRGSLESVTAAVRRMHMAGISLTLLLTLLAAAISVRLSRQIAAPFKQLQETFEVIASGDLTVSTPDFQSQEASLLSERFNAFTNALGAILRGVKNESGSLSTLGDNLSRAMEQTAASISQIIAAIQSVKGQMLAQSSSVTEASGAIHNIIQTITSVSANIEKQNKSVATSSAAIEQVLANIDSVTATLVKNSGHVKTLEQASDAGQASLRDVAKVIEDIAKESEGLSEINAVMENIAVQTNLLSMNAAIEAAHAGAAGNGFAVVAGEIRKLSDNSAKQSQTISEVLERITGSIEQITQVTNAAINKFAAITDGVREVSAQEASVLSAMEEQSAGGKQILDAVEQLNELTKMVSNGSTEMMRGSQTVVAESQNLDATTEKISTSIKDMAAGAEDINTAVSQVSGLTVENKSSVAVLEQAVSRFKVA